jgi:hypothetical protein
VEIPDPLRPTVGDSTEVLNAESFTLRSYGYELMSDSVYSANLKGELAACFFTHSF